MSLSTLFVFDKRPEEVFRLLHQAAILFAVSSLSLKTLAKVSSPANIELGSKALVFSIALRKLFSNVKNNATFFQTNYYFLCRF